MSASRFQSRLGFALIVLFIVGLVVINARVPERIEMNEEELGNIVRAGETEFKEGFGAFPEIVPDNGGDQPVPFDGLAPQRYPQYRSEQWLAAQDKSGYTIQLAVFSSERGATEFLTQNGNSADLRYFELPEMPDPALGLVTAARSRFIVTYGEFYSEDQAVAVAGSLTGFGGQFLVRPWESYQISLASVRAVLAKNYLAQQEALANARAAAAAKVESADLATQPFQGVDPVESLQKKQDRVP